jgi:Na+/alanine symporter
VRILYVGCLFTLFGCFFDFTGTTWRFRLFFRAIALAATAPPRRRIEADVHRKVKDGKMSNFAAVATLVGGNLGAGTIAGTALAIAIGGPGSIFWMIVMAILGSAVKLASASLGVLYQEKQHQGRCVGGPMFYMLKGVGSRPLSICYCVFIIGASLSVGNLVQINAFTSSLPSHGIHVKIACVLAFIIPVAIILSGGLRRFAAFMSCSIPLIGIAYIIACFVGIIMLRHQVSSVIKPFSLRCFFAVRCRWWFNGNSFFTNPASWNFSGTFCHRH